MNCRSKTITCLKEKFIRFYIQVKYFVEILNLIILQNNLNDNMTKILKYNMTMFFNKVSIYKILLHRTKSSISFFAMKKSGVYKSLQR